MHRNTHLIAALTLALQGLALPVGAEVVLYDNTDGAFQWLPNSCCYSGNSFDPTQSPTQSGELTQFSLIYETAEAGTSTSIGRGIFFGQGDTDIAVGPSFLVHGSEGAEATVTPPKQFQPGDGIGPDADWNSSADHSWTTTLDGYMPLLDDQPFIGFRTGTGGQYRYGWIELGRRSLPDPYGSAYQPLRWAYETELNTQITVIPEPASVISLLLCLVLAACLRSVWPTAFR